MGQVQKKVSKIDKRALAYLKSNGITEVEQLSKEHIIELYDILDGREENAEDN